MGDKKMAEPIVEPKETPKETTATATAVKEVIKIAVVASVVAWGGDKIDDAKFEARIAKAKTEMVDEKYVEAKEIIVYDSIVVDKEDPKKIDTIGKKVVTAPARIEPIINKYNFPDYTTAASDTFTVSFTRKRGDSLLYYGVYTPNDTCQPVLKVQFIPKGKPDTSGVK
jgi:hypothetical protein